MYVPEPGHVVWAWIRPLVQGGAGGRAARIKVHRVEVDHALDGRLWLTGTELDLRYHPAGDVSVLVESDRLWLVAIEGDE